MAAADSALEVRSGAARQCNRQKKDKKRHGSSPARYDANHRPRRQPARRAHGRHGRVRAARRLQL